MIASFPINTFMSASVCVAVSMLCSVLFGRLFAKLVLVLLYLSGGNSAAGVNESETNEKVRLEPLGSFPQSRWLCLPFAGWPPHAATHHCPRLGRW